MEAYLFPAHVALLALGLVSILKGILVARFAKKQKWWLKAHRVLAFGGALFMAAGVAMAATMVALSGGPHFRVPHAFLGAAAILSPFAVALIGAKMLKLRGEEAKEKGKAMRRVHRIAGRTAALLLVATAASGALMIWGL